MKIRQYAVGFLFCCSLSTTAAVAAEACSLERGAECFDRGRAESPSGSGETAAAQDSEAEGSRYTWDDLVELVPELREYDLRYRRRTSDESEDEERNPLVCRKFTVTGTRIPQRRCAPLLQFVAYKLAQRRRAERTRVEILLR
ncbi:MAG: hypothetical protein AAGA68_06380 [Pseudomonadota bacterium]